MENKNKRKKVGLNKLSVLMAAILGLMILAPIAVQADSLNPGVLSVYSPHYGSTYEEWSAVWWHWALSQPVPQNPLVDDTGVNSANGQQGPVWFLAGKFCVSTCDVATADRAVTVPAGKALFFPILNSESDNLNTSSPFGGPPLGLNESQLREASKGQMDLGQNLIAEVDGVPISGLDSVLTTQYRVISPVFNYHIPDNNIYSLFGATLPKQTVKGAISDGVFLMLAPLSKGQHKIHFAGAFVLNGKNLFALDIKYTINVV